MILHIASSKHFSDTRTARRSYPNKRFLVVNLEHVRENAHHDDLGFWERWADGF